MYELGIAGGGGYLPDYPAANEGRVRSLVVPNFRYRGKVFRADEDAGVRARLFNNSRFDFDLSFGGAFPVNAGDNRARKDMKALDWLVEFGPRLFTILWDEKNVGRLRLGLPIRAVFSTPGTSATYQGIVAVPGLVLELFQFPCERCRVINFLGPTYVSNGVGDYFYEVPKKDVTNDRPRYDGKAGYMGTDLTTGLSYQQKKWEIFIGARYSNYRDAANRQSPLYKNEENLAGFIALGWLLYQSDEEAKL